MCLIVGINDGQIHMIDSVIPTFITVSILVVMHDMIDAVTDVCIEGHFLKTSLRRITSNQE